MSDLLNSHLTYLYVSGPFPDPRVLASGEKRSPPMTMGMQIALSAERP